MNEVLRSFYNKVAKVYELTARLYVVKICRTKVLKIKRVFAHPNG